MRTLRPAQRKKYVLPVLVLIGITSCIQPDPKVLNLDKEYGFRGFSLGPAMYREVQEQAEDRAKAFDVVEFETFGSRFADNQTFDPPGEVTVFGLPATNIFAGVMDQSVYALLFQIETDGVTQEALNDSLIAHYGRPQSIVDTTYLSGALSVREHTLTWKANRVALEFGRGDGFAEVLIYDREMHKKRVAIQEKIELAQSKLNPEVNELSAVGSVRLNTTVSTARWRYRFRGEKSPSPYAQYGAIDYSYVEPFFDIRGKSLYGAKIAFANMRFQTPGDSLKTLDVEFDNTQGQVVGFMDMFRVLERRLGQHAYSDTLYTIKGPYRRAFWYGEDMSVNLEEYRFRPERPDQSDVRVRFVMDRVPPTFPEPMIVDEVVEPDSVQTPVISTVSDSSATDTFR